jgi:uncharacterized protein YndB with AHSA1/START domain
MPSKDTSSGTGAHPALDVRYDTFVITRGLDAPSAAVFAAFADEQARRRWFRLPGSRAAYRHEFRVDGGEDAHSTFAVPGSAPQRLAYRSRYLDIVADRRIVFAYESIIDDLPHLRGGTTLRLNGLAAVLAAGLPSTGPHRQ